MSNEINARDLVRSLTIGAKKHFKKQLFTYKPEDGDEFQVEFREMTRKKRSKLMKLATKIIKKNDGSEAEKTDNELFMMYVMIEMTFIPGTNDRVFEEGDIESLWESPASSGFVEAFIEEIGKMLGTGKIEDVEKNSEVTGSATM